MNKNRPGQPRWWSLYPDNSYDSKISNSRPDLGPEFQTQDQLLLGISSWIFYRLLNHDVSKLKAASLLLPYLSPLACPPSGLPT